MRLKLVQVGEEVLRKPAREIIAPEIESDSLRQLITDMRETLRDAPGVGLAAPQVGVPLRLAVIEDLPEYSRDIAAEELALRERQPVPFHVIINPEIVSKADERAEFFEGCLSLAGFTALVPRARRLTVRYLDEHGRKRLIEASGWYARILQHEIDHLNGNLYIDCMHSRTFMTLDNFNRRWRAKSIDQLKRALMLDTLHSTEPAP